MTLKQLKKCSPFASGLLWGQQPPDLGPGAKGSADDHGLSVQPAVCRWLSQGSREGAKRGEAQADATQAADEPQLLHRACICKWFNVGMGFGFLSMTARAGSRSTPRWTSLCTTASCTWKVSEASRRVRQWSSPLRMPKVWSPIGVTGPGGVFCIGSERGPKGKSMQKRRSKGDRCYNSGGLDHHAKECKLPPQPKKCHFCQSISHMVAACQQGPSSQGKPVYFWEEEEEIHGPTLLPEAQN